MCMFLSHSFNPPMSNDSEANSSLFNPAEFASAAPVNFTLAGALFTRLNSVIEDTEKKRLQVIIQDLRHGKLDPLTPPFSLYDYFIEVLQFYEDKTLAELDLNNDIDVEVSIDVLMRYRALKRHYVALKKNHK